MEPLPAAGGLESHDTDDANAEAQTIRSQQRRPVPRGSRRKTWSASELATLALAHCRYGNAWSQISRLYRTRTDADVKNIFHSALRSKGDSECILRAYAQAVGPNCDDAATRQAAYDAAKAQFGGAPVLTSAAGLVQPGVSPAPPAGGESASSPGPAGPSAKAEQGGEPSVTDRPSGEVSARGQGGQHQHPAQPQPHKRRAAATRGRQGSPPPPEAAADADAQPSAMEGVAVEHAEGPSSGNCHRGVEAHSTASGKRELHEPEGAERPGMSAAGAAVEGPAMPRRSRRRASRLDDVGLRASTDGYGPSPEAPPGLTLVTAEPQVQNASPAQSNLRLEPSNSRPEAESNMLPAPLSTMAEQLHQMTTTSCEAQWATVTQGLEPSRASLPPLSAPMAPQPRPFQLQPTAPQPDFRLLQPPTAYASSLLQRTLSAAPQQGRLYGPAAAAAALLQGRASDPALAAGPVASGSGLASLGSAVSWQGGSTLLGPHLLPPRLPSSDGMAPAPSAGLYGQGGLLGGSWLPGSSGYGLGGAAQTAPAAASSAPGPPVDPLEALFRDLEGPSSSFGRGPATAAGGLAGARGLGGGGGSHLWSASTMPLVGYGGNARTLAGALGGPVAAFEIPRMASSPAALPSRHPSSSWSSPSAPAHIADGLLRGNGAALPGIEQAAPGGWPSGLGAVAGAMEWQPLHSGPNPQGASPVLSGGPSSLQSAAPSSSGLMWQASTRQTGVGGGGSASARSSGGGTRALEVLALSHSPFTALPEQGLSSYPPQAYLLQPLKNQLLPQAYHHGPLLQQMTQQRHAYGLQQHDPTQRPPQAQHHQPHQFAAEWQGSMELQGVRQNPAAAAVLPPGRRSLGGVVAPPAGSSAGGPTA